VIYYKNSPLVRSTDSFVRSDSRTLSSEEINQLIAERKVTPIGEIKFDRNSSRISRPGNWVYYDH
jgi:hypothetical protein